jgi:mono/diheme cytochrome c family protein
MRLRRTFASLATLAVLAVTPCRGDDTKPLLREDPRMVTGAAIYRDTCRACHGAAGQGVKDLIPRLAGSEVLRGDAIGPIALVLQGGKAGATTANPTAPAMPSLGWRLNDRQVADVLTYARNSWGNAAPPVDPAAVKALRP